MKPFAAFIASACVFGATASFEARDAASEQQKTLILRAGLVRQLEAIAAGLDGVMGYSVLDLSSGDTIAAREAEVFPTASTIKLAVLYELFRQADEGRVRLDELVPVPRTAMVGGSGVLFELTAPQLSLRDLATLMVVLSDNTASNIVIDKVGLAAVNERMLGLGLSATKLRRRMMDIEAARAGRENVSTPGDLVRLLQLLHTGQGLQPASRDAALAMLKKAKTTPLVRGLPAGTIVASKPGDLDGVRADAGIVYVEGRPYVIAVMTTFLADDLAGERAIEAASRAAYQYFSRLATGGEYGRRIGD